MSSLNLVPNPTIMLIQAGVFLTNLVVVKKLLLEPYLSVREERVKLTCGSQDLAEALRLESDAAAKKIQTRLQDVGRDVKNLRDDALAVARARRDETLQKASIASQDIIAKMRSQIVHDLSEQKLAIPVLVQNLSKQLFDKIVPA